MGGCSDRSRYHHVSLLRGIEEMRSCDGMGNILSASHSRKYIHFSGGDGGVQAEYCWKWNENSGTDIDGKNRRRVELCERSEEQRRHPQRPGVLSPPISTRTIFRLDHCASSTKKRRSRYLRVPSRPMLSRSSEMPSFIYYPICFSTPTLLSFLLGDSLLGLSTSCGAAASNSQSRHRHLQPIYQSAPPTFAIFYGFSSVSGGTASSNPHPP